MKKLIYQFKKHNAIYFRITKVAGTSFLVAFRQQDDVEETEKFNTNRFKFVFVRNPFDRIVSAYKHVIQKGAWKNIDDNPELYAQMEFGEFIDVISKQEIRNMNLHFRPQWTFIPVKPDYVGRFEHINKDFVEIMQKIGLNSSIQLPHKNFTRKTNYQDFYDEKSRKAVVKIYRKDFDMFKYNKKFK